MVSVQEMSKTKACFCGYGVETLIQQRFTPNYFILTEHGEQFEQTHLYQGDDEVHVQNNIVIENAGEWNFYVDLDEAAYTGEIPHTKGVEPIQEPVDEHI